MVKSSHVVFSDYEVRVRAYRIWEQRGKPDGAAEEHWRDALAELEAEAALAKGELVPPRPDVTAPPQRMAAAVLRRDPDAEAA